MGEVRSRVREITEEERASLTGRGDAHLLSAVELRVLRVLEFDIAIDSMTTYVAESDDVDDCVTKRPLKGWQEQVQ